MVPASVPDMAGVLGFSSWEFKTIILRALMDEVDSMEEERKQRDGNP